MDHIVIQKDVPVPKSHRGSGRRMKYPLEEMKIGDSFVAPHYIYSCIHNFVNSRELDWKFKQVRISPTEVGIWRTR
jgi:hypothetical protein